MVIVVFPEPEEVAFPSSLNRPPLSPGPGTPGKLLVAPRLVNEKADPFADRNVFTGVVLTWSELLFEPGRASELRGVIISVCGPVVESKLIVMVIMPALH